MIELVKKNWTEKDFDEFEKYLYSLKGNEKEIEFEKKIVNTNLDCLAIKVKDIKYIVSEISKGNYISYIDLFKINNHTESIILGNLICKIKDFENFKTLLTKYANVVDNWASCDCIKVKIKDKDLEKYFLLAEKLINSKKEFATRIGFRILFNFINTNYLSKILNILNNLNTDKYYVKMICAWLLCECFIKKRDETLIFFNNNTCDNFIINKSISKCHDSFRVNKQDKKLLNTFKKNIVNK